MNNIAFELLTSNIYEFNDWRRNHPDIELDFCQCSFDGLNLSEGYLFGIDFMNCSFKNCNLQESIFSNSVLDNSDFFKANMKYVVFGFLELYIEDVPDLLMNHLLSGASLKNCSFKYTNLTYADFRDTDVKNADFSFAELEGAKFIDTNYKDAFFDNASVSEALFNRGR